MTHYSLIISIHENFQPHDPIEAALVIITYTTQAGGTTSRRGLTDGSGQVYFASVPELTEVHVTMTKEGYITKTATLIKQPYDDQVQGYRLIRVTVPDDNDVTPTPIIPGMEDITGLFTWTNIAKAGAVVVLISFGSRAFSEFKEAFKK